MLFQEIDNFVKGLGRKHAYRFYFDQCRSTARKEHRFIPTLVGFPHKINNDGPELIY